VVTDSFDNTQSGSYTFSLLRLNQPASAVPLSCGARSRRPPAPLSAGVYSYTAAAGESFTVRMLPGGGNPQPGMGKSTMRGVTSPTSRSLQFLGRRCHPGSRRAHTRACSRHQHNPGAFHLHVRPDAHQQRLLGACRAGPDDLRRCLRDSFLAYSIPPRAATFLALRSASSTRLLRADGTLRSQWYAP
jgi:hypothetical protein